MSEQNMEEKKSFKTIEPFIYDHFCKMIAQVTWDNPSQSDLDWLQ